MSEGGEGAFTGLFFINLAPSPPPHPHKGLLFVGLGSIPLS